MGTEPEIELFDGDKQYDVQKSIDDLDSEREALRSQLQILDDDDVLKEDSFPNVQVRVLSPQDLIGGTHLIYLDWELKRYHHYPNEGALCWMLEKRYLWCKEQK